MRRALLLASGLALMGVPGQPVFAAGEDEGFRKKVTDFSVRNVRKHQKALQRIADRHGDTRAAGTAGYDQSAAYVKKRLERAGYDVELQEFDFIAFEQLGPATLQQTEPGSVVYEEDTDFAVMSQTDSGDVSGAVTAVDLALIDRVASTSGCEPEDFAGFPAGTIALMQRGTCSFQAKAENASAAGAVGAVIFNQGNTPEREVVFGGTLSADYAGGIPVVSAAFALGAELAETEGAVLNMVVDTQRTLTVTSNVVAERPGAAPDDAMVIVTGAHLDSVDEGAGINDNGSGSAAILEIALRAAKYDVYTHNRLRFAWWSAEESGLIGSQYYVDNLSEEELAMIGLNLNFDMIGSPNFVRFVYDGDGSDTDLAGPAGSDAIEQLFQNHFAELDLPVEPSPFNGRSDYGPFIAVGIPAGGLFSGAEGIKTEEQAAIYGGTAGEQYDPCYHEACDTFENNSNEVLGQFTKAAASVLGILAYEELPLVPAPTVAALTTASVNASASMDASSMEYRGNLLVR